MHIIAEQMDACNYKLSHYNYRFCLFDAIMSASLMYRKLLLPCPFPLNLGRNGQGNSNFLPKGIGVVWRLPAQSLWHPLSVFPLFSLLVSPVGMISGTVTRCVRVEYPYFTTKMHLNWWLFQKPLARISGRAWLLNTFRKKDPQRSMPQLIPTANDKEAEQCTSVRSRAGIILSRTL